MEQFDFILINLLLSVLLVKGDTASLWGKYLVTIYLEILKQIISLSSASFLICCPQKGPDPP